MTSTVAPSWPAEPAAHRRRIGRAILSTAVAERERWVLWLPVGVALGVVGYFAQAEEPTLWPCALGLAASVALAILGRRTPVLLLLAATVAALALGAAAAKLRTLAVAAPVLETRIGPATVSGRVIAAEPWEGGTRIILSSPVITGLQPDRTPQRVRLRLLRQESAPSIGATVALRAVLMPPTPPALPGAYDFARQAYFKGIGGVGYAVGRLRPVAATAERGELLGEARIAIERLRQAIHARVTSLIPDAAGAMSAALITGDQSAIPTAVMEAMRDAGLAHLLAISGFNVALVAAVLFGVSRFLFVLCGCLRVGGVSTAWALRYPVKKWAAVVTMVGVVAYTLITGASVPTQRACLMTIVVLVAVLIDRSAISMRLVMWAALTLLVIAPETLLGASFQMSFAAVIALIAAYEGTRGWLRAQRAHGGLWRRIGLHLGGMLLTTLVAAAATAPFAAYHFNRLAVYQLVANFLAVPLTAVWIMPWATLSYVLLPFGLEAWALRPMSWGVEFLIAVAQTVTAWPNAILTLPSLPAGGLAAIALGGIWLCLWRRAWRLAGLVPILIGCATLLAVRPPDVLVAADGSLFAVRDSAGALVFSDQKGGRSFLRDTWSRRAGVGAPSEEGERGGPPLACDGLGCLYARHGHVVAFVRDTAALPEDCGKADVIVSALSVPRWRCPGPGLIVDRRVLATGGAHALWLDPAMPPRVASVGQERGNRPWSGGH